MRIATPLLCVGYADAMRIASGAARDRAMQRSGEDRIGNCKENAMVCAWECKDLARCCSDIVKYTTMLYRIAALGVNLSD